MMIILKVPDYSNFGTCFLWASSPFRFITEHGPPPENQRKRLARVNIFLLLYFAAVNCRTDGKTKKSRRSQKQAVVLGMGKTGGDFPVCGATGVHRGPALDRSAHYADATGLPAGGRRVETRLCGWR